MAERTFCGRTPNLPQKVLRNRGPPLLNAPSAEGGQGFHGRLCGTPSFYRSSPCAPCPPSLDFCRTRGGEPIGDDKVQTNVWRARFLLAQIASIGSHANSSFETEILTRDTMADTPARQLRCASETKPHNLYCRLMFPRTRRFDAQDAWRGRASERWDSRGTSKARLSIASGKGNHARESFAPRPRNGRAVAKILASQDS